MKILWNILLAASLFLLVVMWTLTPETQRGGILGRDQLFLLNILWAVLFVIGRIVISRSKKRREASAEASADKSESDTRDAYSIAEQEIETDSKDESLWKKAFVDAGGDEGKQKALYMKYRAEEINS